MTEQRDRRTVQVVVVPTDIDYRQIGPQDRALQALQDHVDDVRAAVEQMTDLLLSTDAAQRPVTGWRVATLEATFGLTLTAEAGVIVSKASAEASLEVKITVERTP